MKFFLTQGLCLLLHLPMVWATPPSIDSLENVLATVTGEQRSKTLSELTWNLRDFDLKKALHYSLENYALVEELSLETEKPRVYNYVGIIYRNMGNYAQAIDFYHKALIKAQDLKLTTQEAYAHNNIGEIFLLQNDAKSAKSHIQKAIRMFQILGDKRGEAYGYLRLGEVYEQQKIYEQALKAFFRVEELRNKMVDKYAIKVAWHRIGIVYGRQGDYQKALEYVNRALVYNRKTNDIRGTNSLRNSKAEIYLKLGRYNEAIELASLSLKETSRLNAKPLMYGSAQVLHMAFAELGEYEKAYSYQQKYIATLELFLNERNLNHINALNFSYELAKKQAELERVHQQNRLKQSLVYALIAAVSLLAILIIVLYRGYWLKKRANGLLQLKNLEIEQKNQALIFSEDKIRNQRDAMALQNRQTTKSIKVAKTIQEAILPHQNRLKHMFEEHFVIYRPRDVVSGDFYWVGNAGRKKIVAAIDCTGHGVPGAFMSMIGFVLINETVNTRQIYCPGEVLEQLRVDLRKALRQEVTRNREGMDMALITVESLEDEQVFIEFAGAKRPLWYVEKGSTKVEVLEGSRVSIGINYQDQKTIVTKHLQCAKGTLLYMGSDGFADQNDQYRKKLGSQRLAEMIFGLRDYSLAEQQQILEQRLDEMMLGTEQRDDILLLGLQV
ncbi:hypothetical protein BKI52_36265 [marine bacterium AO1-C]|nr:hypothetical protein BKI52_36265 [marine bacterium AO1-C]